MIDFVLFTYLPHKHKHTHSRCTMPRLLVQAGGPNRTKASLFFFILNTVRLQESTSDVPQITNYPPVEFFNELQTPGTDRKAHLHGFLVLSKARGADTQKRASGRREVRLESAVKSVFLWRLWTVTLTSMFPFLVSLIRVLL